MVDESIKLLPPPKSGNADWRDYRCFEIANGVTVCLVHDKESKTTATAATVTAGASSDPRDMSGLAHFCEHMCFLGSQKYPGENEYKSFLAQHGGRSNASTSMHLTTYKFEILADHAEHALDLFSNFFTAPLFTESGIGREVQAVDSENSKNLTADVRRRLQILKHLGDQTHWYTKFSTGNAQTLETKTEEQVKQVREALLAFHRKHYRPENLTVVVAGPQSLDQLQEWVVPRFALMKQQQESSSAATTSTMTDVEQVIEAASQDAPPYHYTTSTSPPPDYRPAFRPDLQTTWPAVYTVKPVRSMRRLVLMFPLPPVFQDPDRSPISVLSHLLGHEGPNSSFAVLQNAGLLSALSAGPRVSAPDFSLFQVDMTLTSLGEARWKDVVDVMFQHCRLIADAAAVGNLAGSRDMRRIWGEKAALESMFFDQASPGGCYGLVPSLSNSIVAYGTEQCIAAGSMLKEREESFPLEKMFDFASRLVPSNCLIERCGEDSWKEIESQSTDQKDTHTRKSEPWYNGIDYWLSKISPDDVWRWERKAGSAPFLEAKSLALPSANKFIPRTLELCPDLPDDATKGPRLELPIAPPNLVMSNDRTRLWHRLDDRYALPKSSMTLLLRNAAVEHKKTVDEAWEYDSVASVSSTLLGAIFRQALAQETYDASLAGLHWNLSFSSEGISLACSGFSDRLSDLSLHVLDAFLDDSFIQELHFLSAKDRILRNLQTYFQSRRADSYSIYYRDFLLESRDVGLDAAIAAVESATLESVKAHHRALLLNPDTVLECLYSGNVPENEAISFFSKAVSKFGTLAKSSVSQEGREMWIPGSVERRLVPGNDIELHFESQNAKEENGSVVVTYQSPVPSFRGESLSSPESLHSSATISLLGHILREPLFDELRTKQTLGYIVSSYSDVGLCSAPQASLQPWTVPVDFLVVSVLSRKVSPTQVVSRIDEFLTSFRDFLSRMPESEIKDQANALSTKLQKPIQKLNIEASSQFRKIRRYAPGMLHTIPVEPMPWDNTKLMARTIESLGRQDLVQVWDRMMAPKTRARIVSCVYGTTFPLDKSKVVNLTTSSKKVVVNDLSEIISVRNQLSLYDNTVSQSRKRFHLSPSILMVSTAAVVGAGLFAAGWTMLGRSKKLK